MQVESSKTRLWRDSSFQEDQPRHTKPCNCRKISSLKIHSLVLDNQICTPSTNWVKLCFDLLSPGHVFTMTTKTIIWVIFKGLVLGFQSQTARFSNPVVDQALMDSPVKWTPEVGAAALSFQRWGFGIWCETVKLKLFETRSNVHMEGCFLERKNGFIVLFHHFCLSTPDFCEKDQMQGAWSGVMSPFAHQANMAQDGFSHVKVICLLNPFLNMVKNMFRNQKHIETRMWKSFSFSISIHFFSKTHVPGAPNWLMQAPCSPSRGPSHLTTCEPRPSRCEDEAAGI